MPDEIRSHDGRPDFGVRDEQLPGPLIASYFVESSYGDVVHGLVAVSGRTAFLASAVPVLHEYFGCDARLMLAAPWRLFEPIGPILTVVIYTKLTKDSALDAHRRLKSEWLAEAKTLGIDVVPVAYESVAPHAPSL